MFGFSRRQMKLGRRKAHLPNSSPVTKNPTRQTKCEGDSTGKNMLSTSTISGELNYQLSSTNLDFTSENSEHWMVLSTLGEKPPPRFNHAAAIVGNKMVIVGGETNHGLLGDVQVLDFDKLTWTSASPKFYLSPSNLPLEIPACKGHCLVSWGKKAILVGGKMDPTSEKISVWAFDIDNECWSHVEAKGDIPVARSGHTVVRAGSVLMLFGGEDAKGQKLNDLHMFDLKSLRWLPLHCIGSCPPPRSYHVAVLHEDKVLLIFGGASKSRILNDLYSLDFETMTWSRVKTRGFHPSPRAGCCGVLCGCKWYIAGGASRKKRHSETLVLDVRKFEWTTVVTSSLSSVTSNKGFSLMLMHRKDNAFLVAFGGSNKKEISNQVEVLAVTKNDQCTPLSDIPAKDIVLPKKTSKVALSFPSHFDNSTSVYSVNAISKNNLAAGPEHHGSGRRSLSEFTTDPSSSVAQCKHNQEVDYSLIINTRTVLDEGIGDDLPVPGNVPTQATFQQMTSKNEALNLSIPIDKTDEGTLPVKSDGQKLLRVPTNACSFYEAKMAALLKRNSVMEGQLAAAVTNKEAAERNLSVTVKSRQETERRLDETLKEMEELKEKLSSLEVAQEEANDLTSFIHADNVRLEHDVAFLKAILDDTQQELHSTRGVLAGERARAFQLQVEIFHLKQRLHAFENRVPTPRKPFNV